MLNGKLENKFLENEREIELSLYSKCNDLFWIQQLKKRIISNGDIGKKIISDLPIGKEKSCKIKIFKPVIYLNKSILDMDKYSKTLGLQHFDCEHAIIFKGYFLKNDIAKILKVVITVKIKGIDRKICISKQGINLWVDEINPSIIFSSHSFAPAYIC